MPRDPDIQGLIGSQKPKLKNLHSMSADQFREVAQEAQEMVDKAKRLINITSPFGSHRAQLVSFLEQARSQYGQIVCFYEANNAMLNHF